MEQYLGTQRCACGKIHTAAIDEVAVGKGVIRRLPEFIAAYGAARPFLLADRNTWKAAGETVAAILQDCGISFSSIVFETGAPEPNEEAVGTAFMHFDPGCDLIIGIGSGVINDIGKLLSSVSGRKYIIVATAPSMDGYASATSSMARDGLKVSLDSMCPLAVIGDVT